MSRSPKPRPKLMSEKTTDTKAPARTIEAVEAGLHVSAIARAKDAYEHVRARAVARRAKLEEAWKKENPDEPFDPTFSNPPAIIPPADTPELREFYRQHYVIAALEKERDELKKALAIAL